MITDELLFRYLCQETSDKENKRIESWLTDNPARMHHIQELRELLENQATYAEITEAEKSWQAVDSRISMRSRPTHDNSLRLVRLARIAAVLLILAGSGLIWYFYDNNRVIRNSDSYAQSVYLPDGTHVDLGPGAKLILSKNFQDSTREVRLSGEAHFDVAPDPMHPFIVFAGPARIKVTGTRFVVNAPPKTEDVEVSVKSGIVLFYNSETMNKNSFRMDLAAGEKGYFSPALKRMDKTRDPYFHTTP
jgi:ferric-dicitrate binding protein FerR (iron transport regulator)